MATTSTTTTTPSSTTISTINPTPTITPTPITTTPTHTHSRLAELEHLVQRLSTRLRRSEAKLTQAQAVTRRPARCVFSDLDGTLLHFGGNLLKEGYEVLPASASTSSSIDTHTPTQALTPPFLHPHDPSHPPPRYVTLHYKADGSKRTCIELPSLTSGPGYISTHTLTLIQKIRDCGCVFVIITGARSSTYLMRRRTGLPLVDYEIIEGGGRLVRDPEGACDFATIHHEDHNPAWDLDWKKEIGPLEKLWGLYEEMKSNGWVVDGRDYYTNFRVDVEKGGKSVEEWEGVKARLPSLGLCSSFNLGKADIYPSTSGKAPAVSRLMRRLYVEGCECVALFDDNNDLGMAELCKEGRRIAVSITHESVKAYVEGDKGVETVSRPGILGTEEALERVLASLEL